LTHTMALEGLMQVEIFVRYSYYKYLNLFIKFKYTFNNYPLYSE
jgi:hypothetical protein